MIPGVGFLIKANKLIEVITAAVCGVGAILVIAMLLGMMKVNSVSKGNSLTPISFEVIAVYGGPGQKGEDGRPWRSKADYMIGKPWQFLPGAEQKIKNGRLAFTMDLTGWVTAQRFEDKDPKSKDYMVKFLTFKSNNKNTVAAYIDGDRFRFETRPTDGNGTQYLWYEVDRMDARHEFSINYKLSKPGSVVKRRGLIIHYFGEEIGRLDGPLIKPTAEGKADYWLLGLDLRRAPQPKGVLSRRAVFEINLWTL